jgi:hypothetical protein
MQLLDPVGPNAICFYLKVLQNGILLKYQFGNHF